MIKEDNAGMDGVKAAILAGGEGTRFKPFTDLIAKPMVPVGREEKPLLEYIIRWLSRSGVRDIVLLIGHHGYQIKNYFRSGSHWDTRITYSWDDEEYNDTGGSLLKAYKKGLLGDGSIIVWYGDILATVNIPSLLDTHWKSGAKATLVLADKYQLPVGVAEVEDGRVVRLVEKPWYPLKVTIGVLVIESVILERVEDELGKSFDIMGDLIPWMLHNGYTVSAYIHSGPWYDVGSMERFAKLGNSVFESLFPELIA